MVSMALLWCVDVVTGAFVENTAVGWCTFSGVLFVALGVFYLIGCELHGYLQVRKVDRLSIAMQGDNAALLRKRARYWLGGDVFSLIDAKVDKMVAAEAVIVGAVVGISPWALVESGIVAWRQLRLIKRIAREYGLRPGVAGTCRLIRQIAISVVFADVSEHATQWISSKVPSIGGLIPAAGQAIAVGVLTARVGLACKKVCNPVLNKKYARSGLPFFSSLRSFGKFGIFRAKKLPTR